MDKRNEAASLCVKLGGKKTNKKNGIDAAGRGETRAVLYNGARPGPQETRHRHICLQPPPFRA